jgi:hypothetical protein
MNELEEAIARLARAVARLEAAPILTEDRVGAHPQAAAEGELGRRREVAAAIVARVDAALDRIGQVLGSED